MEDQPHPTIVLPEGFGTKRNRGLSKAMPLHIA
jgi:hypothetical protein